MRSKPSRLFPRVFVSLCFHAGIWKVLVPGIRNGTTKQGTGRTQNTEHRTQRGPMAATKLVTRAANQDMRAPRGRGVLHTPKYRACAARPYLHEMGPRMSNDQCQIKRGNDQCQMAIVRNSVCNSRGRDVEEESFPRPSRMGIRSACACPHADRSHNCRLSGTQCQMTATIANTVTCAVTGKPQMPDADRPKRFPPGLGGATTRPDGERRSSRKRRSCIVVVQNAEQPDQKP